MALEYCSNCGRLGIEHDIFTGEKKCLWNDCHTFTPKKKRQLKTIQKRIVFAFAKTIKPKLSFNE